MSNLIRINNKLMTKNNKLLTAAAYVPPVPPGPVLPSNTVRVRTSDGQPPSRDEVSPATYETATLVAGTSDVYDVYKSGTDFEGLLTLSYNVTEVLGANTTGITNMKSMFSNCDSLTSVQLFNTSSVTTMQNMFSRCSSLTSVPLFDTSSVTNMNSAFAYCRNVESGALALYQQTSSQATPPSNHTRTFYYCGSNTTTGAAELAQIPSSWGGNA